MALESVFEQMSHKSAVIEELRLVASQRRESVLSAIAQVKIVLDAAGLHLIAPGIAHQLPEGDFSQNFANLPEAFAKAYLQLQLRDFLYDNFCAASDASESSSTNPSPKALLNDRAGGGLHRELFGQLQDSNHGTGYFDLGWEVVSVADDDWVAITKHGVVVHAERSCHLAPQHQFPAVGEMVSIHLPPYRFESDFYVAVGNKGPVGSTVDAMELYIAADMASAQSVIAAITQMLNAKDIAVPYTLRLPYRPEDYRGAEVIALRIETSAQPKVKPLLRHLSQTVVRNELPVFAYPLQPGISVAKVIDSGVTEWFGSWADLSRCDVLARGLVELWEEESFDTKVSLDQVRSHLNNLLAHSALPHSALTSPS